MGQCVFGTTKRKVYITPGWSEHVEELYEASINAFRSWRAQDSPREGPFADRMRRARATFKHALRQCRAREDSLRAERLTERLREGNMYTFWREIRKLTPRNPNIPTKVDEAIGRVDILHLWKDKYCKLLNSVNDEYHLNKFKVLNLILEIYAFHLHFYKFACLMFFK